MKEMPTTSKTRRMAAVSTEAMSTPEEVDSWAKALCGGVCGTQTGCPEASLRLDQSALRHAWSKEYSFSLQQNISF